MPEDPFFGLVPDNKNSILEHRMLTRTLSGEPPKTILPPGAIDTQNHIYLPGFASAPGAVPLPPDPPSPDDYRRVMAWLGIERVVITQGNAHGRDNGNLLACLAQMGAIARGVGIIDGTTSDAELARLADGGIVGARIMDLAGGAVGLGELEAVDGKAAAMGWCLAVQFDGSNILEHEQRLSSLDSRWILDHHGKFLFGVTPNSPEVDAVKRLIDKGQCWFKFAGCYESSRQGGPNYEDIGEVARVIAAHAPDRIIWGSNFPHNSAKTTADYPNDAALLDLAMSWLPDDESRRKCLLDNPQELFFR